MIPIGRSSVLLVAMSLAPFASHPYLTISTGARVWHRSWTAVKIALVFALGLQFCACAPSEDSPLRLGTNVWPGYEPLYLAEQLGYYPENAVDLVEYLSASDVIKAFRNESIEAAAVTLDEALLLLEHDIPIKLVLVTDVSAGGDVILAKSGIENVGDLAGKRIGVEGGALGAYMLSRALDLHGIALDALDVVQLEVSEHEAAYQNDTVDAVVTFEPVRSRLLAAGAKEIFSSREIPGEIVDVIVVHESHLRKHLEQVTAVVNGWFRALDYLDEHPEDAAARMSRRLGIGPEEVLDSYQGMMLPSRRENEALLGGTEPQLLKTVERLQDMMLKKELLAVQVATDSLLTTTALRIAVQ